MGFIDARGRFAIAPIFETAGDFSEGLAAISADGDSCGYIDHGGRFRLRPRYRRCERFSDGVALVGGFDDDDPISGYIDKTGKVVLRLREYELWSFSDGLTVAGETGKRMYFDRNGRAVAPYEVKPAF
jgi:hypothetical protein